MCSIVSTSTAINRLSAARLFLFGARDIWFVVAVPVFLADELGWSDRGVGAFLALWVIGYGIVQSSAPRLLTRGGRDVDEVAAAQHWALVLAGVSAVIAVLVATDRLVTPAVVGGLIAFGVVFAMTSLFAPDLAELSIFVLMALVLLVRPQGFFGKAGLMS